MPPYRQFACYLDQLRHKRLKLLKITCKLPIRRHQLNHHKKLLRPTPPTSLQFKLLPIPTAIPMKPAWHNQTQPPAPPSKEVKPEAKAAEKDSSNGNLASKIASSDDNLDKLPTDIDDVALKTHVKI